MRSLPSSSLALPGRFAWTTRTLSHLGAQKILNHATRGRCCTSAQPPALGRVESRLMSSCAQLRLSGQRQNTIVMQTKLHRKCITRDVRRPLRHPPVWRPLLPPLFRPPYPVRYRLRCAMPTTRRSYPHLAETSCAARLSMGFSIRSVQPAGNVSGSTLRTLRNARRTNIITVTVISIICWW